MTGRLILLIGLVSCGRVAAPKEDVVETGSEITNPSPTTWVEKLPPQSGKHSGGVPDYPLSSGKRANFEDGTHGLTQTGANWIGLTEQYSGNTGHANFEISVEQGKVRLYVKDPEKKYRYIEATPGHPARIFSQMVPFGEWWYIVIEAVDGDASGIKWHAWTRNPR
jgi:hypothetical protein